MKLLNQIGQVRFRRKTSSTQCGWEMTEPRDMETDGLVFKIRYHMKQLLACLLELQKRDVDVCGVLSKNLLYFKECRVSHDTNNLKMYVKLEGK